MIFSIKFLQACGKYCRKEPEPRFVISTPLLGGNLISAQGGNLISAPVLGGNLISAPQLSAPAPAPQTGFTCSAFLRMFIIKPISVYIIIE